MTRARMGTEYKSEEWVEFFAGIEPGTAPASARVLAVRVRGLAARVFYAWRKREEGDGIRARHFPLPSESRDRLAYLTYASIVGHGVGLWEGDFLREIYTGTDGQPEVDLDVLSDSLDAYVREAASEDRFLLHEAVHQLDAWACDVAYEGEE